MSKKSLPFFVPLAVLLFASLACSALSGAGPASGFQATANAAFTQAAGSEATAGAIGNSAGATANAAATQLVATANAATGGGATGGDSTATPAAGQPTAAATTGGTAGGGGPVSGGPQDIPVIDANSTVQVASQNVLSYITTADVPTVVKFYKDSMPQSGWTLNTSLTVETATASTVAFTKDSRNAVITIGSQNGQTVVAILVS